MYLERFILAVLLLACILETDLIRSALLVASVYFVAGLGAFLLFTKQKERFTYFWEYSSPNGRYGNYGSFNGYPYYRGYSQEIAVTPGARFANT